jgi:Fe2+ transport system protein B
MLSGAEPVSFSISPSSDNVREVLGFLHYQVSQQSKEIAVLNRRVAQLMQSTHEQERIDFTISIDSCNQRIDTFTASVRSITEQLLQNEAVVQNQIDRLHANVRNEISEKIRKTDARMTTIQQIADNSKVTGDALEL